MQVGTLTFAAPEQLQYSAYGVAVDVWALGCVFACVAHSSKTPYPAFEGEVVAAVARGKLLPSVPQQHCLHAYVRDCTAVDPTDRPSAATLARDLESDTKVRERGQPQGRHE